MRAARSLIHHRSAAPISACSLCAERSAKRAAKKAVKAAKKAFHDNIESWMRRLRFNDGSGPGGGVGGSPGGGGGGGGGLGGGLLA